MTNTTPPTEASDVLTTVQQQRTVALTHARRVLTAKGFASDSGADAIDLVAVAGWIIDGRDPWPSTDERVDEKAAEAIAEAIKLVGEVTVSGGGEVVDRSVDPVARALDKIESMRAFVDDEVYPQSFAQRVVGMTAVAADQAARDIADAIGLDPDAPLPDDDGDDTQLGSVTA